MERDNMQLKTNNPERDRLAILKTNIIINLEKLDSYMCYDVVADMRARITKNWPLFKLIKEIGYQTNKDFTLTPRNESDSYFDIKKVSLHAEGFNLIGSAIFELVKNSEFDSIGTIECGGVPILTALISKADREGRVFNGFYVRKEKRKHRTKKNIEGVFQKGEKVILLKDVVTTGNSVINAVKEIRKEGGKVDLVVSVIDRQEGAAEYLKKNGVKLLSLFIASDFI